MRNLGERKGEQWQSGHVDRVQPGTAEEDQEQQGLTPTRDGSFVSSALCFVRHGHRTPPGRGDYQSVVGEKVTLASRTDS